MSVHQCPVCELRFLTINELETHVIEEHPDRLRPGFPSAAHVAGHLERVEHPAHPSRRH